MYPAPAFLRLWPRQNNVFKSVHDAVNDAAEKGPLIPVAVVATRSCLHRRRESNEQQCDRNQPLGHVFLQMPSRASRRASSCLEERASPMQECSERGFPYGATLATPAGRQDTAHPRCLSTHRPAPLAASPRGGRSSYTCRWRRCWSIRAACRACTASLRPSIASFRSISTESPSRSRGAAVYGLSAALKDAMTVKAARRASNRTSTTSSCCAPTTW